MDFEKLIGIPVEKAIMLAKMNDYAYRITVQDGVGSLCVSDYRLDRINFEIENNTVIRAYIG